MPGLEPWFPQLDQRRFNEDDGASDNASTPHAAPPAIIWPAERAAEAVAAFDQDFDRETLPPPPNAAQILARLMRNALVLIENGETRLAKCLLRNVLMRDPRHPEALRWMAYALRQSGQHEDAAKCARALTSARPQEDASWFLLGEIYYELERDDDARAAFEKALMLARAECPFLFDIYKLIGNACVRAGDFDAAEESYNKAFAINPNSDALMVNYGTLEIQREQLEAAVLRFRAAVEINPENDRGWVGLALVHRAMGDQTLAWANLERALDVAPTNRTGLRLAIDWGSQDRDFSVAIRRLQAHLGAQGDDAEMSFALARIFAFSRRFAESRLELERAMALEPRLEGAGELLEAVRFEERQGLKESA